MMSPLPSSLCLSQGPMPERLKQAAQAQEWTSVTSTEATAISSSPLPGWEGIKGRVAMTFSTALTPTPALPQDGGGSPSEQSR